MFHFQGRREGNVSHSCRDAAFGGIFMRGGNLNGLPAGVRGIGLFYISWCRAPSLPWAAQYTKTFPGGAYICDQESPTRKAYPPLFFRQYPMERPRGDGGQASSVGCIVRRQEELLTRYDLTTFETDRSRSAYIGGPGSRSSNPNSGGCPAAETRVGNKGGEKARELEGREGREGGQPSRPRLSRALGALYA